MLALYTQSSYCFESRSKTSEIHVLETETGKVTVLSSDANASEPRWLGDGHQVIWLRGCDNGNTSFVVTDASDPGKTYTAGTVAGGVSNLKLCSLDSDKVAIAVSGLANVDGTLNNPKDAPKSRTTAKIYDSLYVRHWDSYVEPQKNVIWTGILQKSPARVTDKKGRYELVGLTNVLKDTNLESPIPPFGGTDHFDISPKGIVFVAKDPELDPALHTKCNTYYISTDSYLTSSSSTPKHLSIPHLAGAASCPVFSPDGESLALLQMETDGYEADKNRIVIFPQVANAGDSIHGSELFASSDGKGSWDRSPSAILWANDGRSLIVEAEDIGRGCVFHIPLQTDLMSASVQAPSKLTENGTVVDMQPASATSSKIFVSSTSLVDNSIFSIIDPSSPSVGTVKVSSLSHDGAFFGLSRKQVSELWWEGAHGHPVHAWMVKPSTFSSEKKYPLALLIHGGPQGAWRDGWSTRWNPAVFAEQGYVVVCPNPRGSTSYGQKFTDDIRNSWGGLPFEDVSKGVDYIEANLSFVDSERMVMGGASYGGYFTNWTQGQPLGRKFKALVTHDGIFSTTSLWATEELYFPIHDLEGTLWENPENYARYDPSRFLGNWQTPHLIIHNELDYRLTMTEGLAAFNVLQTRGVESRFLTFPDENHWVIKQENSLVWHRVVLGWINKYVGLPPPHVTATGDDGLPDKLGWKSRGLRRNMDALQSN